MRRVGRKGAIGARYRPRATMHIQLQRGREIRQRGLPTPRFNTGKLGWQLGSLPGYMRQVGREIGRMLPRPATDFQNISRVGEKLFEHLEDRAFITVRRRTEGSGRVI